MSESNTKLSIKLSYLLRHGLPESGYSYDVDGGWMSIVDCMEWLNLDDVDVLHKIVDEDAKGRYQLVGDRIRATQGHSFSIVPIFVEAEVPDVLYHGTTLEAYSQIIMTGFILPMSRNWVHWTADRDLAVRSAKRWKGKTPIVLKVPAKGLSDMNLHQFMCTTNNVWHSDAVNVLWLEVIDDV